MRRGYALIRPCYSLTEKKKKREGTSSSRHYLRRKGKDKKSSIWMSVYAEGEKGGDL